MKVFDDGEDALMHFDVIGSGVRDDNGERIDVDASGMFAVNLKVFMMTTR